jgi:Txe/YoeB family toxin of Txe-Axe toxin-antitoxin module
MQPPGSIGTLDGPRTALERRFPERWSRRENLNVTQGEPERADAQSAKDKLAEKFTELVRAVRDTASMTTTPKPPDELQ